MDKIKSDFCTLSFAIIIFSLKFELKLVLSQNSSLYSNFNSAVKQKKKVCGTQKQKSSCRRKLSSRGTCSPGSVLLAVDKRSMPKAQENGRNEANNLGYVYMKLPGRNNHGANELTACPLCGGGVLCYQHVLKL